MGLAAYEHQPKAFLIPLLRDSLKYIDEGKSFHLAEFQVCTWLSVHFSWKAAQSKKPAYIDS